MKISKYLEFIKEEVINDTPEANIEMVLKQLKRKIDKMFEFQNEEDPEDQKQNQSTQQQPKQQQAQIGRAHV